MSEDNIPQMRETIERLSKDNSSLKTENSGLTSQLRTRDARDAFRDGGYVPKNGDLYAAMNPDGEITAEAVTAFADEQGLPLAGNSEDSGGSGDSTEEGDGSENLSGMSGSGSGAGDGGAGGAGVETLTRQEWQALHATDPAAAQKAIASGRVEISKDNPFVKGAGLPRGTNPYVASVDTD